MKMKRMTILIMAYTMVIILVIACATKSPTATISVNRTTTGNTSGVIINASEDFVIYGTTLSKYNGNEANVTIPEGITVISSNAFSENKSLVSLTIPASVTSIRPMNVNSTERFFYRCDNLVEILVNERNTAYSSIEGVLFNKQKTELIRYPPGKQSQTYTIPNGTIVIRPGAFDDAKLLIDLTIPRSVTSMPNYLRLLGRWSSVISYDDRNKIFPPNYTCTIADLTLFPDRRRRISIYMYDGGSNRDDTINYDGSSGRNDKPDGDKYIYMYNNTILVFTRETVEVAGATYTLVNPTGSISISFAFFPDRTYTQTSNFGDNGLNDGNNIISGTYSISNHIREPLKTSKNNSVIEIFDCDFILN